MDENETFSQAALTELAASAFTALGVPPDDATIAAETLVIAEMMGIKTHGLKRVPAYGDRIRSGGIKADARIACDRLMPALLKLSGDNGLGPAVAGHALRAGMKAASECGASVVFCAGSNHLGATAPYALLAAETGFASIIATNTAAMIPPTGGKAPRLGNNPLGFGVPNPSGDPVVLDMALSVAARAKIREAVQTGQPIPEGWATDAEGRATTDAAAALAGLILPMGGYKGYGLAVALDLLTGLLSGAGYLDQVPNAFGDASHVQNIGHLFILIDTARLMPEAELGARMQDFARRLHETPPVDPAEPVRLPGERSMARFRHAVRHGISPDPALIATIRAMTGSAAS